MSKKKTILCWVCEGGPRQGGWALCLACEKEWRSTPINKTSLSLDLAMWAVNKVRNAMSVRPDHYMHGPTVGRKR